MAAANLPPRSSYQGPTENNEPRTERKTKGEAHLAKKKLSQQFVETFVTDDIEGVKKELYESVTTRLIGLILDAINEGLSMIFKLDRGKRSSVGGYSYNGGGYDYAKISSNYKYGSGNNRRNDAPSGNTRADYSNIVYATKEDANDVLSTLQDLADPDQYGQATLADLYDAAGISISKQDFTDNKWGWRLPMLKGIRIRRIREGWVLDLPKPIPLE